MCERTRQCIVVALLVALCGADASQAQRREQRSGRSERVRMEKVGVSSPDGKVKLTVAPNAERLTFSVTFGDVTVLEPSTMVMKVDGYDLSSGVVFGGIERYEVDETYPWHGAHSTARNRCNGARVALAHDLSFINYVLEVRVFDDGVALRHIVAGAEDVTRVPD